MIHFLFIIKIRLSRSIDFTYKYLHIYIFIYMFKYNHYRIISCMCASCPPGVQIITGGEQLTIFPSRVSQPSTLNPLSPASWKPSPHHMLICISIYFLRVSIHLLRETTCPPRAMEVLEIIKRVKIIMF